MVWSQYKDCANNQEHEPDYDDDKMISPDQLEYEDWKTWYSTDLFNMWQGVVGYIKDSCLEKDLFNEGDYDDFCTNIYNFSSKFQNKND